VKAFCVFSVCLSSIYQRYRGFCARRIRRLRKALKYSQGDFKRRDGTLAQIAGQQVDERFMQILLTSAELAWYAIPLKQESNMEPRKRFNFINKLRKACSYALQLQELCKICFMTCCVYLLIKF